jgi:hypothetical protein
MNTYDNQPGGYAALAGGVLGLLHVMPNERLAKR